LPAGARGPATWLKIRPLRKPFKPTAPMRVAVRLLASHSVTGLLCYIRNLVLTAGSTTFNFPIHAATHSRPPAAVRLFAASAAAAALGRDRHIWL
jgi:hypothetical protein